MSASTNSTVLGEKQELGTGALKYVLVTALPIGLLLVFALVLVLVARLWWKRQRGNREYRRVPTKDALEQADKRQKRKAPSKVQVVLPDPPAPRTTIALATNFSQGSSKSLRYVPHKSAAVGSSCTGKVSATMEGVADSQAFLCLKMCVDRNRLTVEVQNAAGLPCRADGTPSNPLVMLNVLSREKRQTISKKASSTNPVYRSINPKFMQTLDCGSVIREELANSILHIQVLDQLAYSQHDVLAEADLSLDQVKEKPAKSFRVPLNLVKHPSIFVTAVSTIGRALITLYNDTGAFKLSVTITKVDLFLDKPPSTDYSVKLVVMKGQKRLAMEKAKCISVISDEIHFNTSIDCHNLIDVSSLSVHCSLVTTTMMKRSKLLGIVTLGSHVQGQALRHWNDMLNTPNTLIAEWHDLTSRT